jgi:UDP-glucose 4-epimerase
MALNESLKGEVINVGSGRETCIRDLIDSICRIMGYKGGVVYRPPRPGDVRRHYANIEKARRLLSFEPRTCLEEALNIVVEWYKGILCKSMGGSHGY